MIARVSGHAKRMSQMRRAGSARRMIVEAHRTAASVSAFDDAPVIVVGMHRSGTSVVARILHELGVHMGSDATAENFESQHFLDTNDAMLAVVGSRWDRPMPLVEVLDDPAWVAAFAAFARGRWVGRGARPYWHDVDDAALRSAGTWGWKDPRSSVSWPVWTTLFPRARIVNVTRDEAAVVASLRTRSEHGFATGTGASFRTLTDAGCAELRAEHLVSIERLRATRSADQVIDVRYEALLDDPRSTVSTIAAWVGAADSRVEAAAGLIHRNGN